MAELRAMTVKQPWAHMIAHCGKTTENRTWATSYRGELAIHAGAYSGWDKNAESSPVAFEAWRRWAANWTTPGLLVAPLTRGDAYSHFKFGAVIAVAELAGCHRDEETALYRSGMAPCSPWSVGGAWHWELRDVRPLADPVPCKGKLGLWRLPEDTAKAVRAQLEAGSG
jgi:hypothetical protein